MFLKLTNDDTASFYDNESMNAESKEPCFKFNPCHCSIPNITYCFEADITDDLLSFLKRFGVEIDQNVAKLQFYLYQDGDIGLCSQK